MSRFANLPRPSFGRRAGADEGRPAGTVARGLARRAAMLHEAQAVLTVLPAPGEALHALITGRYDLMHLLVCLLQRLGPARAVRIATLSYSAWNLMEMLGIMDAPNPPRLTLLCSAFFRDHNKELWEETLEEFRERGQRCAAARTHAKVITLDLASGVKLSLEGSANLRSNSNREQFALVNDAGLHDWHARWIDDLVTQYEGENDNDGEGG
jgi:hypothetical protein